MHHKLLCRFEEIIRNVNYIYAGWTIKKFIICLLMIISLMVLVTSIHSLYNYTKNTSKIRIRFADHI